MYIFIPQGPSTIIVGILAPKVYTYHYLDPSGIIQRNIVQFLCSNVVNPAQLWYSLEYLTHLYMGDTCPNHTSNSCYRNPTFYHIGT